MRKLLSIIFFVLLCCYAMAYDFSAVCSSGQTLYYNITSNVEPYTVEVVPENESLPPYTTYPTGDLEIPETVEYNSITYTVTSIGELAFCQCSELTGTLTIPESVTNIGAHAFEVCSGLTGDLTIPESVTSIGDYAFSECIGLTSVSLPNSVASIGNDVFWGCSGFTEPVYNANSFVFFPNGYTTEYTIPDGIQRIEGGAFKDCSSLTSITIPESVTFIGDGAFFNCSDLTSFTIPNSITSIGEWAFSDCFGLTTVNFYAQNCTYMPHAWYNATFTTLNIGERVKIIPDYAFSGCTGLTEITIPDSVVYIGYETFCSGLITVNFNATSCTTMYQPFTICEALATLNIGENVTNIPEMAFWGVNISNINAYSYTPPTIDEIAFENGVYLTANVYTPCAAANSYRNYQIWEQFANIQGDTTVNFSISVQTENETMGSVTGGGNYSCEAEASITAMPGTGYRFLQWNDGNTDNPRTVIVTSDITYTAGFKAAYIITASAGEGGVISPSGDVTVDEGESQSFTIEAAECYSLASVLVDDVDVTDDLVDGVYTFENVTAGHTIAATFEQITYTITSTADNGGTITPAGNAIVNCGDNQAFTIEPDNGYRIASVMVDGIDAINDVVDGVYIFENVTENHTIAATFEAIPIASFSTNPEASGNTLNITPGNQVEYTNTSLNAHHIHWYFEGADTVESVQDYVPAVGYRDEGTFLTTLVAYNEDESLTDTATLTVVVSTVSYYTISVISNNDAYGMVSGGGTYEEGTEITLTAMPYEDYRFVSWNDGNTENPRTITVTSDSTFVANFRAESEPLTVYWRCTFEESTPLYTTGQFTASDANWELQTISESEGTNYYYAMNSYGENHPYGEVSETPEHWMMIDGDGANQDGYDFDSYLLFSGIDLSDAEHPEICFYEYRSLYNIPPAMEATVVEVSIDGGETWTKHIVGCEEMEEHSPNYQRVPIFEATGRDNVVIRFRANRQLSVIQATYGGNPTYASAPFIVNWQVDDIVIKDTPAFDLAITDVRMNDGLCDYYSNPDYSDELGDNQYNYYQYKSMFGQTPRSEWTSPNKYASFNVAVENRGYETVTPIVHISVSSPSGLEIWNVDFTGDEIEMEQCDTIDVIEYLDESQIDKVFRFTEEQMQNIEIGEYIVTYSVNIAQNEDQDLEDNVRSHPFYITGSGYSPATPNITTTCGPNRWSSFEEGDEILAIFEYNVLPEDEIPLYVYIPENTEAGTAIAANIYEYNEASDDFEISFTSGTYTIEEDDLGTWINIPLETPLILSGYDYQRETKTIRVGIAFYNNGYEHLHIGASEDMPNKGWIYLYNNNANGNGASYVDVINESAAPAICLGVPFSVHTITAVSNNDNYGYVTGSGTYEEGTEITLTAIPYEGYRFVSWNDNITDNPRTITVTSDSTFVAMFEAEQVQQYTITVLSNNDAYGTVSGSGTYDEGTEITLIAMPNQGYLFDSWEDGNFDNPRSIEVTSDSTFIADFAKCEITYAIDTVVNNFVTVGDHTFYSTGNYSFSVLSENDCDTIFDIRLRVLAEPVYDIGPNPAKSLLNINSDGFISAVEFYTTTGQLVMRKEVNGYEAELDVEGLVDGVYILRIYGAESSLPSVYKVVKE